MAAIATCPCGPRTGRPRDRTVWPLVRLLGLLTLIAALVQPASAAETRPAAQGRQEHPGCRELSSRAPRPGEQPIDAAPVLLTRPGRYLLTKDLEAPGSAIGIAPGAAGSVLDLNGHTITFGAGQQEVDRQGPGVMTYNSQQKGNVGHSAILCPARPDATEDWKDVFPWDANVRGVVIANGRIRSGSGKGLAYSPSLHLEGLEGAEVRDLVVETNLPDSEALRAGPGARVHHCTFVHSGTKVSNRHQQSAVVALGPGSDLISCHIDGGPQAAVRVADGCRVRGNYLRQNAKVSNGYGVQGFAAKDVTVDHNWIIPYNGRGIHLSENTRNWKVHHNYIEVRETKNAEYATLETHGIKLERTRGAQVHDNLVIALPSDGGAPTPLNLSIDADSGNRVEGNTFIAVASSQSPAYAAYLIESNGRGAAICDNIFFSSGWMVGIPWDSAADHVFRRCTFRALVPGDRTRFISFENGNTDLPSRGTRLIDCRFLDGVSPRDAEFPPPGAEWRMDGQYAIGWSLSLRTAPGAAVQALTKDGQVAARGTADRQGDVSLDLLKAACLFSAAKGNVQWANFSPYRIRIALGNASREFRVDAEETMEGEVLPNRQDLAILVPARIRDAELQELYRFRLSATEQQVEWKVEGRLPAGLALKDGAIQGKPTETGTFPFTLSARSGGGQTGKSVSLNVGARPEPPPRLAEALRVIAREAAKGAPTKGGPTR